MSTLAITLSTLGLLVIDAGIITYWVKRHRALEPGRPEHWT